MNDEVGKLPEQMLKLYLEARMDFASMVKIQKGHKKGSEYVEKCKYYLAKNIHKHVSMEELAKEIGVNRTYLSGKFSEQEGMSMTRYNMKIRLEAAENMLKYSDVPISEIAEWLCFSSQSHLGREFKKKNNVTPAQFRRQNRNAHLIDKQTNISKR